MNYLLRPRTAIDSEVSRVMSEQALRARRLLRAWREDPPDRVHQARQAFKRIRALLRLVRPGARYVYRVENDCYRDLGRMLALARDTEAVIEALSIVEPRVSGPLARESLRMLKVGLEQRAVRQRDCGLHDLPGRIDAACLGLDAAVKRLRTMPLEGLRRKHLRTGAQVTLERCATAFAEVVRTQSPEQFHAWRKEVKYAYHQTRLMQQSMPRWASANGPALGALADLLGHYHDLCMLDALLRSQSDELNLDVHLRSMRNAVRHAMTDLRAEGLERGSRLFEGGRSRRDNVIDLKSGA